VPVHPLPALGVCTAVLRPLSYSGGRRRAEHGHGGHGRKVLQGAPAPERAIVPAGADILLCASATHSNAHTLGCCGQAPGPAAPGSGPGGLIPALRRRRRRGAGRQAPVASQGRPAAPATREQGPGGGLSRLPPHLGSLVPMTRGGGKPWLTAGAPPAGALVPAQLP